MAGNLHILEVTVWLALGISSKLRLRPSLKTSLNLMLRQMVLILLIIHVSLNLYFVYCQRRQTDGPG